jgi:hypothetical protein
VTLCCRLSDDFQRRFCRKSSCGCLTTRWRSRSGMSCDSGTSSSYAGSGGMQLIPAMNYGEGLIFEHPRTAIGQPSRNGSPGLEVGLRSHLPFARVTSGDVLKIYPTTGSSRNLTRLALLGYPTIFLEAIVQAASENARQNDASWSWKTLESLSMDGDTSTWLFRLPTDILPRLKMLSLSGAILQIDPDTYLPSVEALHLGNFECDAIHLFRTITSFPSLKELKIFAGRVDGELFPGTTLEETTRTMKISRVVLVGATSRSLLTTNVTLPSLEELCLQDMDVGATWSAVEMTSTKQFFSRHPLKLLSLEDTNLGNSGQIPRLLNFGTSVREIRVPNFRFLGNLKKQKQQAYFTKTTRIIAERAPTPGLMEHMFRAFEDKQLLLPEADILEIGVREGWPRWIHQDGWPARMQQVGVEMVEI